MKNYTAPYIDRMLRHFDRGYKNPSAPSLKLREAMEPLFHVLSDLAPMKNNKEAKSIWIQVPRGGLHDYGTYEDMVEYEEVNTYEEYVQLWQEDYPEETVWYELIIVESSDKNRDLSYRGVFLNDKTIINASMEEEAPYESWTDDVATELCTLLTYGAIRSMSLLRKDKYNLYVDSCLPYKFRTGVVKRDVVWTAFPEMKENIFEGMNDLTYKQFRQYLEQGDNDASKIGRILEFTGNDFLRACAIGYKACGYKGTDLPLADQYFMHADGRDEGLTGKGQGLNAGPGIDLDSPAAWDEWYYDKKRFGGHPWEVCRGGNSTHVDLFVRNDKDYLDYKIRIGEITAEEAATMPQGYYFQVAGDAWNRSVEAVNFYVALKKAKLPVVLSDADAILARFQGMDHIGIVPHTVIPVYCSGMFPNSYGKILDFMHVHDEEMQEFGSEIEWLREEPAKLQRNEEA